VVAHTLARLGLLSSGDERRVAKQRTGRVRLRARAGGSCLAGRSRWASERTGRAQWDAAGAQPLCVKCSMSASRWCTTGSERLGEHIKHEQPKQNRASGGARGASGAMRDEEGGKQLR
jgi:hypothetical protein